MFTNVTFKTEGFESSPDVIKEINDSCSQTNATLATTIGLQTAFRSSCEVQTEELEHGGEIPQYNEEKLAAFLRKTCPVVLAELDKADRSKAFTNYKLIRDESQSEATQLYKLRSSQLPRLPKIEVSSICWSCTGNVVAIGFCSLGHFGWCEHESAIHFYNISKQKVDTTKPDRIILVDSCVSILAMHPYEPSVIAAGSQMGEILLWSTDKDEYQGSYQNRIQHKSRVSHLAWVTINSQLSLFTSSLDGYIFSFKVIPALRSITLNERFLPNSLDSVLVPGITTFAFSRIPGIFVAALEGGELLHCSTFSSSLNGRPQSASAVKQPVLKSLGKELGEVITVEFSPHVEHLYVTVHIENKLTVRSLNEEAPLYEIYTDFVLVGAHWSLAERNVIIGWGNAPQIAVYHVKTSRRLALICPEGNHADSTHLLFAAVNHKSTNLIAIAGVRGCAYIWKIPQYFKLLAD